MGWDRNLVPDPQAESTFLDSKLDWSEPSAGTIAEMLELYRDLIALRRSGPELTDPRFGRNHVEFDDDERWLLVDRSGVRIAVNMSDEQRTIPLAAPAGHAAAGDRRRRLEVRAASSCRCRRTPRSCWHRPTANDTGPRSALRRPSAGCSAISSVRTSWIRPTSGCC